MFKDDTYWEIEANSSDRKTGEFLSPQTKKRRLTKVTSFEKDAWEKSDVLAKTVDYLFKTDLRPEVRRKMIRDMIKDSLIEFHKKHVEAVIEKTIS